MKLSHSEYRTSYVARGYLCGCGAHVQTLEMEIGWFDSLVGQVSELARLCSRGELTRELEYSTTLPGGAAAVEWVMLVPGESGDLVYRGNWVPLFYDVIVRREYRFVEHQDVREVAGLVREYDLPVYFKIESKFGVFFPSGAYYPRMGEGEQFGETDDPRFERVRFEVVPVMGVAKGSVELDTA